MGNNKDAIFILLGIVLLIGLSWDPAKKGAFKTSSVSSSGSSTLSVSKERSSSPSAKPVSEKDISKQIAETKKTAEKLKKEQEEAARKKLESPYHGKIRLSHISSLNNKNPSSEYITVYTNLDKGEKVNLTGWQLKSERTGNWVKLGKASVLPFPFSAQNDDVVLNQGDRAYLVKGFSPIGISFRTNKCTGYFGENRTFYPYIGRSCPVPRNEELPQFSTNLDRDDECVDLIKKIPACTTARTRIDFRDLPDTVTESCKEYMETQINYNVCVADHYGDTDFPGNEWYVYMNIFGPLWRDKHEKINLLDTNGLIVSTIEY